MIFFSTKSSIVHSVCLTNDGLSFLGIFSLFLYHCRSAVFYLLTDLYMYHEDVQRRHSKPDINFKFTWGYLKLLIAKTTVLVHKNCSLSKSTAESLEESSDLLNKCRRNCDAQ